MRGFYAGLLAGMIGGIGIFVIVILHFVTGLQEIINIWQLPDIRSVDLWIEYLIYHLGGWGIFGGIFGIIYSILYNGVPSKGAKKGIIFGCIIGLFANISVATHAFLQWLLLGNIASLAYAIALTEAFLIWFIYGIVLGPLYARWSLT